MTKLAARVLGLTITATLTITAPAAARVVSVGFESAAFGHRVTNTVYLPDSYDPSGPPSPVVYYLHGTVLPELDNPALAPLTHEDLFLNEVGPGGGSFQTNLFGFENNEASARFVVVAPDTDPNDAICDDCLWIDGREGHGVNAETFVLRELMPRIETQFNVRRDRAGRGVMGFSMGGWSTLLYAFRHPDLFAFAGAVSPAVDVVRDPAAVGIVTGVGYLRDQGYGDPVTDPLNNARFNPVDLAANAVGSRLRLVLSTGDGCLGAGASAPDCRAHPFATNAAAGGLEALLRNNVEAYGVPRFHALGLPFTELKVPGVHGADNASVYRDQYVGAVDQTFAHPQRGPRTFSFRSADTTFQIWSYAIDHPSAPRDGFVALRDARRDGHTFTIAGRGDVTVTTPPGFTARRRYTVTLTPPNGPAQTIAARADDRRRVSLTLHTAGGATRVRVTRE